MKQPDDKAEKAQEQGAKHTAWRSKQHGRVAAAVCAVGLVYVLYDRLQIGCPVLFFTGIPCMGCGMTRALSCLVRLDFAAAFAYHPLVFLMPPLAEAVLCRKHIPPKLWRALWVAVVVAFVAVYALRLLAGGDAVVRMQWDSGLLGRALAALRL